MRYTAAVLTISDRSFRGEREDASGPEVCRMLSEYGWEAAYTAVLPDEMEQIKKELIACADERRIPFILTVGGTGFSPRDVTPEATLAVIEREARGIPEAMRAESMRITPRGCLSRSVAGIRNRSLIVNLPGSPKAAVENLSAVLEPIRHGIEMLCSEGSADCTKKSGRILAVCTSKEKGQIKLPQESAELLPDWGLVGDAHAGNWHRQVSLLGKESVEKAEQALGETLVPGAFAENILTEGLCLYALPVGTRLLVGSAVCEVTQIGKECHQGCEIRKKTGDCVMPREGIFAKVIRAGKAKAGDAIEVLAPPCEKREAQGDEAGAMAGGVGDRDDFAAG